MARSHKKTPRPIPFPTPYGAFTRGYRRALADGIDPLDQLDPVNECRCCGHIPCCKPAKTLAPVIPAIVEAAA